MSSPSTTRIIALTALTAALALNALNAFNYASHQNNLASHEKATSSRKDAVKIDDSTIIYEGQVRATSGCCHWIDPKPANIQ